MPTGGGGKTKTTVTQTLPGMAKFLNAIRAGQEFAFDPFRAQARGLYGTLLDPYSSFQNPRAGFTTPAGTVNENQLTRAIKNYMGGAPATGSPVGGASGSTLPGYGFEVLPTPGTPGSPGTPFMSARDVARQAFLDQTGLTGVRDRRLDRFIRNQARLGNVFEDRPEVPATVAAPGTPGILSQNPVDAAIRAIYDKIPGITNLRFQTPEQAFAASRLASLTDVSSLENAAARNLEAIVGPQLMAGLNAQGLGRSGAYGEALAQQAAGLALPIAQTAFGAQKDLANFINAIGTNRMNLIAQTAQPGTPFSSGAGGSTGNAPISQSSPFDYIMGGLNAAGAIPSAIKGFGALGGVLGLGGGLGGLIGGSSFLPAAMAAPLSFLGGLSSRRFKENIKPLSETDVMSVLRKTPIYTWNYRWSKKPQVGLITEEAPELLTAHNRLMLDPVNYFGVLHTALKNVDKRLARIEYAH